MHNRSVRNKYFVLFLTELYFNAVRVRLNSYDVTNSFVEALLCANKDKASIRYVEDSFVSAVLYIINLIRMASAKRMASPLE